MSTIGLSLIIPAYNEQEVIQIALQEAHAALTRLGWDFEIIVVDDGCTDLTVQRVRQMMVDLSGIRLLSLPFNQGYGAALRTGFLQASKQFVAFTDADCQFYIEDLELLMNRTHLADIVVGNRADRQDPWLRKFYSRNYNRLVRTLLRTQVKDCDCALKVFHSNSLRQILPATDGFFINAEMLSKAHQQQMKIEQVDVRHRPRAAGVSKVSLIEIPKIMLRIAKYWYQSRRKPVPVAENVSYLAIGGEIAIEDAYGMA
ncbi:MAG: glycosyltransferase family 2 protein [Zavarzinella sp.]